MSKARETALGFMIGFNKASSQALIDIIKSYRQGILDGDNDNGNVTEDYTTPTGETEPPDIPLDDDGTRTIEPAGVNMTTGAWWIAYGDEETQTPSLYIKVWNEPDLYQTNTLIRRNHTRAAIYNADGSLNRMLPFANDGWCYIASYTGAKWNYIQQYKIKIDKLSGSRISVQLWYSYTDENGAKYQSDNYDAAEIYIGSMVYLNTSTVKPF